MPPDMHSRDSNRHSATLLTSVIQSDIPEAWCMQLLDGATAPTVSPKAGSSAYRGARLREVRAGGGAVLDVGRRILAPPRDE